MTHIEHTGQRFADVRRWLDISHRALGRVGIEAGIEMHESLWASWERRPQFPASSRDTVKAILHALATRLEGDPEKWASVMLDHIEQDKKLPKPPTWKDGMKPLLRRGRRPGPQKPGLRIVQGENQVGVMLPNEAVALATDVIMEAMAPDSPPLPEKVKELLKLILQSNVKKAVPFIVLFWLGMIPTTQNALPDEVPFNSGPMHGGLKLPRASNIIPFPSERVKRRKKRAANH